MKDILVIGETCDDTFVYGECNRLCPEAPVPVFLPYKETNNGGMASNVYSNLKSLRPDWRVNKLTNVAPIKKIRYVDSKSGQMLLRVDANDSCDPIKIEEIVSLITNIDAVVISDYCKGFLSISDITEIGKRSRQHGIPTFLDTKKTLGSWVKNVDYLKINDTEFHINAKTLGESPVNYANHATVITKGGQGCDVFVTNGQSYSVNGFPSEVREVSGAGDSFLAGLVCRFLEKGDILEAASYANLVASIAVSHRGVVAVTKKEVDSKDKTLDK